MRSVRAEERFDSFFVRARAFGDASKERHDRQANRGNSANFPKHLFVKPWLAEYECVHTQGNIRADDGDERANIEHFQKGEKGRAAFEKRRLPFVDFSIISIHTDIITLFPAVGK